MAYASDTLGYAKRLRDAGVRSEEAEAHAEAAREFIMTELVTKQDLDLHMRVFEAALRGVEQRIESLELRLMVRVGGMIAIAVAVLAAIIKF